MHLRWFLLRLLLSIPALFGITLVTFMLASSVPGDPVYALVGERADAETIEAYRKKLGLEQGGVSRYVHYIGLLLQGNLGQSYYSGRPVSLELMEKLPNTILLATAAMVLASVGGLFFGSLAAFYEGSLLDRCIVFLATSLISFPVFWFGMVLVYYFAVTLKWFPVGGMEHPMAVVLPAITLGARSAGYLTRLVRIKILDAMRAEYITTVRAKGGGPIQILAHALRNAILPIITFIGLDFGSYLNGSVLTETIFGWDGIGRYAINGILRRDYPVILGTVLLGAVIFMLVNIVMDIIYVFLNPRLRKMGASTP